MILNLVANELVYFGILFLFFNCIIFIKQIILKLLGINDSIEVYKKRVYRFTEPLKPSHNIAADDSYSNNILQNLENKVLERGMMFDFPDFIGDRRIKTSKKSHNYANNKNDKGQQITLMTYM